MPEIERFSIRLTERHAGARVVLKTAPDGAMVRYSDLVKAVNQRDEELRERLESKIADLEQVSAPGPHPPGILVGLRNARSIFEEADDGEI